MNGARQAATATILKKFLTSISLALITLDGWSIRFLQSVAK
jgi:hypothetical protein